MGREIKFRAFDVILKQMWQWGEIFDIPAWEIFPGTPEQRPWAVMQYTGLKDKNGVEIYEGDIIRSYNLYGEAFAVLGVVKWHDELATYVGVIKDALGLEEVIGNIYENADLLANTVSE